MPKIAQALLRSGPRATARAHHAAHRPGALPAPRVAGYMAVVAGPTAANASGSLSGARSARSRGSSLFVSFALIPGRRAGGCSALPDVALGKNGGSMREKALRVAPYGRRRAGVFLVLTPSRICSSATARRFGSRDAMGNHERFKQWELGDERGPRRAGAARHRRVFVHLGVPIMGAFLWQTAGAVERTIRRTESSLSTGSRSRRP